MSFTMTTGWRVRREGELKGKKEEEERGERKRNKKKTKEVCTQVALMDREISARDLNYG